MINLQTRELVLKWTTQRKTQQEMAELAGCHQSAISRLLAKHKKTGSIKNQHRSGRPTPLTNETLAKLKKDFAKKARAANKKFCSIDTKKFSELIQKTTGKNYTTRHVERILHKLDFSRITPRSQHIKNDPAKVAAFRDEFKKNSKPSTWVMNL
jgi:transposase